jgi:hypothetical protein
MFPTCRGAPAPAGPRPEPQVGGWAHAVGLLQQCGQQCVLYINHMMQSCGSSNDACRDDVQVEDEQEDPSTLFTGLGRGFLSMGGATSARRSSQARAAAPTSLPAAQAATTSAGVQAGGISVAAWLRAAHLADLSQELLRESHDAHHTTCCCPVQLCRHQLAMVGMAPACSSSEQDLHLRRQQVVQAQAASLTRQEPHHHRGQAHLIGTQV